MIEVLAPGTLTLVQDHGRRGFAHLGIPPSGAADRAALSLANRLVGNPPSAAGLELTLSGPILRFGCDATIAITGASIDAAIDGRPLAMNAPQHAGAGETLAFGVASSGLRSYLALRGGLMTSAVLSSRSSDVLTGLGPSPLRRGDALAIGEPGGELPGVDVAPVAELTAEPVLRIVLGPRDDWFTADAIAALLGEPFTVDPRSNRIGLRLEGPSLPWARSDELLSEGVVTGALQVPPSGQPILLLHDHPVTGGYPVIGVVVSDDISIAAQLRPGQRVRFRPG